MSNIDPLKELTKKAVEEKKQRDAKITDLLNPDLFIDEESRNKRYDICKTCPELINFTKQCKKCGCFMFQKTKLINATCPIGKW